MEKIKIVNRSGNPLPKYQTDGSSGMDICANFDTTNSVKYEKTLEGFAFVDGDMLMIMPMARVMIPTGLHIELPQGLEAQIRSRSGLSSKQGLAVVNGIGTIDSDYRGEIMIPLINLSGVIQKIQNGSRIAQMIIAPIIRIEWDDTSELSITDRGEGGFGHTGSV